jgi:hypothetical protein
VKRFIFFQHVRHPAEMAEPEINTFLTHLAVRGEGECVDAEPGLSALLSPLPPCPRPPAGDLDMSSVARRPRRLPVAHPTGSEGRPREPDR